MQPGKLALIIILLPLLVTNGVYLLSAYQGFVPWCMPYLDGCTTISQAARSGDSIFIFRATMIMYGVLLMWFWIYAYHWLNQLYGYITKNARIILWLGIVGAIFLIVYVDYLGTEGEINRFMRRYGIMIFFTFTPLAQLLLLGQHYKILPAMQEKTLHPRALQYQTIVLLLMLVIGIISIILNLSQRKTYETENIVEWNFSFLLYMYYVGMIFIWKNFRCNLRHGSDRG